MAGGLQPVFFWLHPFTSSLLTAMDLRCRSNTRPIVALLLLVILSNLTTCQEQITQETEEIDLEDNAYLSDTEDNFSPNDSIAADASSTDFEQRENASRRIDERRTGPRWMRRCLSPRQKCPSSFKEVPVILISLDGFRAEYLERNITPSIHRLMECGVRSRYLRSIFPTTTFPNHYSIVTGLYPESHGIIDNKMYDPLTRERFSLSSKEALKSKWWEGEPIWNTAEKQKKKTASNFWVGSEVKIKGVRPTFFRMYNSKAPWDCRIETVLSWLELPEDVRPSLITLYFNQPDNTGHKHGPNSRRVNTALRRLDSTINHLFSGLYKRNLTGCVNVILVSDHGMTDKSCDRVIAIDKYVNTSSVYYVTGAASRLRPRRNGSDEAIDDLITNLRCQDPNLLVARKEMLPKRYHFSSRRLIEPVVLGPKAGWYIMRSTPGRKEQPHCQGGTHGYDNMEEDMKAIFIAHGPAFKQNITVEPFLNIELYNLMTDLLNITGAENNGTVGSLHHLLKSPPLLDQPNPNPTPRTCQRVDLVEEVEYSCSCNYNSSEKTIDPTNETRLHLPFGTPSPDFCILANTDYVSAYNHPLRVPLYASYTLQSNRLENPSPTSSRCWSPDLRIESNDSPRCHDFLTMEENHEGIEKRPLFPSEFSSNSDVWLLGNSAPIYKRFAKGILARLKLHMKKWATDFGSINVMSGPCFDVNGNGIWPGYKAIKDYQDKDAYPVPTHYFYVLTRCKLENSTLTLCAPEHLDVLAFILPHISERENCLPTKDYLKYHGARVKDVEILTGLQFFSSLPIYQRIRLVTQLPESLWSL